MADLRLVFEAAKGELESAVMAKYRPIARAATAAIKAAAARVKIEGRADIARALGPRFAAAWRVNTYPKRGDSADAAVYAFHRISYALLFEEGGTVRGKPTLWLPLPNAPKRIGRQRITPALYMQRIGPLRLLKRPGRKPLLVADIKVGKRTAASGRTAFPLATLQRQARKSAKGVRRSIPMFVGIDAAHIASRTHVRRICREVRDDLAGLYAANLKDE